jgi:hypothetical protein
LYSIIIITSGEDKSSATTSTTPPPPKDDGEKMDDTTAPNAGEEGEDADPDPDDNATVGDVDNEDNEAPTEEAVAEAEQSNLPDISDLQSPICKKLLTDAVVTPCCGDSYCDNCTC